MKIAKKSLSLFLSLLMIFTACSVGFNGAYVAFAAAGDSKYTHDQVLELVNAATANGFNLSGSQDSWTHTGDNGTVLAAAEAIFDYATKTYRVGGADGAANSSAGLNAAFAAEFGAQYANANAAKLLVQNVLDPTGTTVYGVENKQSGEKTFTKSSTDYGVVGTDVSEDITPDNTADAFNPAVKKTVIKTVSIQIDLNEYLQTFNTIDDIPASFLTGVTYTYAHMAGHSAVVGSRTVNDGGCDDDTYTSRIDTGIWNYMKSKPARQTTKNTSAKKQLLSYEKYFNDELFANTKESMLEMPIEQIENLYSTTVMYYDAMVADFTDATLNHFGFDFAKIVSFMDDLTFAYRVVAGIHNVGILNSLIGSDYNEESYSEMAALYSKVDTAYEFVYSMNQDIIDYIVNETEHGAAYESAKALEATAKKYIDDLYEIMTEQRLEELVASMVDTFEDYINVLDKENIEEPTDAEIIGLVQKVEADDAVLDTYRAKNYFGNYWSDAYQSEWDRFKGILDEVAEVRDLKMDFQTYYNYFMPVIFTNMIVDSDNDTLVDLHKNMQTQIDAVRASYNAIGAEWGYTIADKIFTLEYEGSDYLLQNLITELKSTGQGLIKDVLIARTEQQLDAVYAYKGVTTVNFDNFAAIKSTLSHFDYDMYDYVAGQSGWINSDYTAKYAEVATLLAKYHLFSESDGEDFFNKNFTFADANGIYATRYAGSQTVEVEGEDGELQIGYPNDIARDGAEDNYYVTEDVLFDTVVRIDNFITSRDFGALVGFVDEEEEAIGLKDYLNNMLETMLFTDAMINQLVGMIFPMIIDLLESELVGAIAGMDGGGITADGIPYIDLGEVVDSGGLLSGQLQLYLDQAVAPGNKGYENEFPQVFKDLGLYIYPSTLADSLAVSNPAFYGVDSDIYNALKSAGRDWTALVNEEEGLALDFEWGVYDQDSFLDALACILDSILPLLQAALSSANFEGSASNAAIAYAPDIMSVQVWIRGGLGLTIPALNVYNNHLIPLFEKLGIENIPTLASDCGSYEIVDAIFGTLLNWIDGVLDAPLSTILDILPNLVYFLSMDSVQEIINSLVINLTLTIAEVDVIDTQSAGGLLGGLANLTIGNILKGVDQYLAGAISFDVPLDLSEQLDLMDLLGFEISDFNEILGFALSSLGADITLPPIRQQDLIFCSDWGRNAAGRVDLKANKGDVMYWFLDYVINALGQEGFLDAIMGLIGGEDGASLDGTIASVLNRVVYSVTSNPDGALAAIVELLNPVEYDLMEMEWLKSDAADSGIEGAGQMDIVYLNYGNDWTKDKSEYVVNNADALVKQILEMTDSEIESLGAFLTEKVNGLFTNDNITALVKMLGGLGDSASAVIEDIVDAQIGINLESWFIAFGYLFPADTWKDDAEVIQPDSRYYINEFGITGVANDDGTITWSYNGTELKDGDAGLFVDILTSLIGEASLVVEFLFAGADVSAFNDLLTVKGYETFDTTLGLLLEVLGVEGVPTQAEFTADAMGSFNTTLHAVVNWLNALLNSETMIKDIIELIPDLFYFIESNGLSVLLHNLLMPILVVVDTVRPLIDVDLNGVLSLLISDFINYGAIDTNVLLQYIFDGIYVNDDLEYEYFSIDINNLTLTEIIKLADKFLGTNLYESGLVQIGIKGLCELDENGELAIDAADTITIVLSALIDCLEYKTASGATNGDVLFGFIAEKTGNDNIEAMYAAIYELITGLEYEYEEPNWGYMFTNAGDFTVNLPKPTISYLDYTTDWTEETADGVYSALDDILALVLPSLLEEGETVATLINGLLEDKVYSDEILNTLVELIVNALASLDASLFKLVDVVLDTDISTWFTFCEEVTDAETGETSYVCTYDFGVDEAAEADKKTTFITGLKTVLAPANELLAFLFFGDSYEFFTGSEKDAEGNYTFNSLITINGGEGYAYGLVPIFEALGIEMKPASEFATVTDAIEYILIQVFALVDSLTDAESIVAKVFDLLPNLIYFLNADGVKVSVNNLLSPINTILAEVAVISETIPASIADLIPEGTLPIDITNITTDALLKILVDEVGIVLAPEMVELLKKLYIGKLEAFTSANGRTAYRLNIEGAEGDVLTIVLSAALEIFTTNEELFADLLPAGVYGAIIDIIAGLEVTFSEIHWGYMYEDDATDINAAIEKLRAEGFGEPTIKKLGYSKDWTVEAATGVYSALDDILALVLPEVLKEEESLATLVNGILEDNVYSNEVVNSVINLIINAIADYEDLIKELDIVLGVELDSWFTIAGEPDAEGNYNCTKDWGIDTAEDKEEAFISAIVTVLEPANPLLNWLFFGGSYEFLSSSTGEVLITLNGGEGYAYGLAPIFEALGLEMAPARAYANVTDAIVDILAKALAFVDELATADSLVAKVFDLLPNLIYFVNAGGLKTAVNNLLAPAKVILDTLDPAIEADLSLEGLLGGLVDGFNILNITTDELLGLAEANGVVLSDALKDVVKTLAVGEPAEFTAANGKQAFRVDVTGYEHDVLTIILSIALDVFKGNEELFANLLGEDMYKAINDILKGFAGEIVYVTPEWGYMYDDKKVPADGKLPARVDGDIFSNYTKYENNWNTETAEVLNAGLEAIVDGVMALVMGADADLGKLLEDAITNGLYTDSILNKLIEMAVGFMVDYEEIIKGAGALIGAEGIAKWFDEYCEIEDGTVTVTKDWGIDEAEDKRAAFVAAFVEAIAPANRLLAWLLFGENFEFFTDANKEVIITIAGGEGYDNALVPLLEAFGVEAANAETFYVNGVLDMTKAVTSIFDSLTQRIAYICNGLNEDETSVTVTEALNLLPNLIYFINAGGLKVVVNNLLAPINPILKALEPMGVSVDFATLIEGIDITNLDLNAVFPILETELGIVVPAELKAFLTNFYIGKLEGYVSANGQTAYRMVYTDAETRIDFITVLISLVADVFTSEANEAKVRELLGDDIYTVLMRFLKNEGKIPVAVQEFDWQFTDKAGTGEVISPVVADNALYDYVYGDLYTRNEAEYIEKWLPEFIDTTITLIGVEINGVSAESLDELLNGLVGSSVYTTDLLVTIAEALSGLVGQLKGLLGDDLFAQAAAVLNASLGVDVTAWDNYTVAEIATGDRDAFVAQLVDMLKPVNPILEWLFTSKELAFFSDIEGGDYVVIEGADGYAYGIIPLLEALGCEGVLTPTEYAADTDGLLLNIINPLLDKVEEILDDPVNELLEVLPGLIYFINSNGVNTVLNNALSAVFAVLANLEPLVEVDLYELIGIDSADLASFDALVDMLLGLVTEGTGLELKAVAMDALNELTMGTIEKFESKNGKDAYTMKLAAGADQVDFVTTILRLVLNFVSIPENVTAIEALLADSLSGDGYTFLSSLLENFSQMAATEDGMDAILYTVYQIFYTANVAVQETDKALGDLNEDYNFLGNLFATSDLQFIKDLGASLGGLLDNFQNGDIIGSEGVAQNGLMRFFQAIKDFFQKIIDFFKNLFS